MLEGFLFIIGIVLFFLNMMFVGLNIQYGNYGMAGINFSLGILVLFTSVILPSMNRY